MFQPARAIHTVEGIRSLEAAHADAQPPLMERAAAAAAALAVRVARGSGPILVVCGPGNNGGDGLVLARLLKAQGLTVQVVFSSVADALPADAANALTEWRNAGGECLTELPKASGPHFALVVDALFGIGLRRELGSPYREWVRELNRCDSPRLALDLPSGLDAHTGRVHGISFQASHTITFIGLKAGMLTADGPDLCGEISIADLGIAPPAEHEGGYELCPALLGDYLRPRTRNSHKGSFGDVVVLGGARGMVGAALLAGRAALHIGAGRVFVGLLDASVPPVDPGQPELMVRSATSLAQAPAALAIGPGLGRSAEAIKALGQALEGSAPVVLDADALNLLAEDEKLAEILSGREASAVLTPHPAEAARLLGCDTESVQADRVTATLELARSFGCPALLKGCGSVVATPDGRWFINTTGNPGMATAGMGDTLSGLIAGLIAQGWPAETALIGAVHLHGAAADQLAADKDGPIGMTASETALAARALFNQWIASR